MLTAAVSGKALWYMTRGTGLVALLLLSASVALGVLEVNRWSRPSWPRFVTAALHKNVSLLATAFLAIHIATAVLDSYAPIRWIDAVIPFASPYRPLWLGFGAVALDLIVALVATSLLRTRLGYRTWRLVHWTAYACWPFAVIHGLGTGTDTSRGWALAVNLVAVAVVLAAVAWRISAGREPQLEAGWTPRRAAAGVATALFPVATVVFLVVGPLRPGWAARAGTPRNLIASSRASAPASPASSASSASARSGSPQSFTASVADQIQGTLTQQGPDQSGNAVVTISGQLTGSAPGALQIRLMGAAAPGGGVSMSSSSVTVGPAGQPDQLQGQVASLQGTQMVLSLHDSTGSTVRVAVALAIDGQNNVTGTFRSLT